MTVSSILPLLEAHAKSFSDERSHTASEFVKIIQMNRSPSNKELEDFHATLRPLHDESIKISQYLHQNFKLSSDLSEIYDCVLPSKLVKLQIRQQDAIPIVISSALGEYLRTGFLQLDRKNVFEFYEISNTWHLPVLRESCLEFFEDNISIRTIEKFRTLERVERAFMLHFKPYEKIYFSLKKENIGNEKEMSVAERVLVDRETSDGAIIFSKMRRLMDVDLRGMATHLLPVVPRTVTKLILRTDQITSALAQSLGSFSQLHTLELSGGVVKPEIELELAHCLPKTIRRLNFAGWLSPLEEFSRFFPLFYQLNELVVKYPLNSVPLRLKSFASMGELSEQFFSDLPNFRQLRTLALNYKVTTQVLEKLLPLLPLTLKTLDLEDNNLGSRGVELLLPHLERLTNLTALRIRFNNLEAKDIEALAVFQNRIHILK